MDEEKLQAFNALMNCAGTDGAAGELALKRIGTLIDLSDDLDRDDGTNRALEWCDALERSAIAPTESALLDYFRANAWASKQQRRHADRAEAWRWEQPELEKQIFYLRRAVNSAAFERLEPWRQCQIFTNLGNQLNTVGRFVEALECWRRALGIKPRFGMALCNRGLALSWYAQALYDPGHRAVFLKFAHDDLTAGLDAGAEYDGSRQAMAVAAFEKRKATIERTLDVDEVSQSLVRRRHSLGRSREERRYRQWCLSNHDFLNPLNDLGENPIAAQDVLTLPSFVTSINEPPNLIGLFNQLKQEFVSARTLYYEGVSSKGPHFSDRRVLLYNTLDYPIYSLAIEKVKASYRCAYSLFDKAGFFLNSYMNFGMDPGQINFRKVWYEWNGKKKGPLRREFAESENWPFRGLFWLGKDLFEQEFRDVMEPDAQALYEIRNQLEHRYLKVHDQLVRAPRNHDVASFNLWNDRLAYSLERGEFEAKTHRLIKLARAALIYLSLGMHREEQRRAKQRNRDRIMPMDLDIWEDEWKV